MKIIYTFTSFLFLIFAAAGASAQVKEQDSPDKITIVNVATSAPVRDGVDNEFTVEIQYTLETADEAMVAIGFNSDKPNGYRMMAQKRIKRGTNSITLKADVKPKDWKERGDFIVYANISPYPLPAVRFTPLVSTKRVIDFEP